MSGTITLTAEGVAFDVHLARPSGPVRGGLVVIHEIWGLVPHIAAVADRLAAEGYVVAAPDILSHAGVAPALGEELFEIMTGGDQERRVAAQPRMREAMSGMRAPDYAAWAVAALRATVDLVAAEPGVDGRIGVTGFCFGGTYTFLLAAYDDRIRAAAPFYGTAPSPERMRTISAPVLALYGAHDPALIDVLPQVRADMADAGVDFEAVVYPDSAHAFFNDTGPRYDPDAGADAWRRVTAFFGERLT
ncbi:dienelactone hydrolase family protein [Microbacter sp. GSS18]|nr:dienelactone hydrolase family protein [Microbacter sp. GSS18]